MLSKRVSQAAPLAPARFSRKAAAIELSAVAEAVRRVGDPTLNIRGRDPHAALRLKERIAERLDRLAAGAPAMKRTASKAINDLAVYHRRHLLGHILETDAGEHQAVTIDGEVIGTFRKLQEASEPSDCQDMTATAA